MVREIPLPLLQGDAAAPGVTLELDLEQPEAGRRQPPTIVIHYQSLITAPDNSSGYVRPTVRLQFGAHLTGEPHGPMPVTCEAATHLTMLDVPAARSLVMDARRTFLEKAAAIHVTCRKGRWGSGEGERYSRHWYDPDRLAGAGIAQEAIRDRPLAIEVAQHKEDFWRATDADEQPIDDLRALSGNLQLVPIAAAREALDADYRAMINFGMLRGEIPSFPELLERALPFWSSRAMPALSAEPPERHVLAPGRDRLMCWILRCRARSRTSGWSEQNKRPLAAQEV